MKHTGIIITAILTVLIMTGCNSDKREIKQVTYGYVIATGNYNLDESIPYASKETREATLPIIKETILPKVLEYDSDYVRKNTPVTATIDTILVQGDTAWAGHTKIAPDGTVSYGTLKLLKESGHWRVHMPLNKEEPSASASV